MGQRGTFPALDSGRPADPPRSWTWHSGICILTKIDLKPPISAHSTSVLAQEHIGQQCNGVPVSPLASPCGVTTHGCLQSRHLLQSRGCKSEIKVSQGWPLLGLQSPPSRQSLRGLPSAHKRHCFPCASQSPLRTPVRLDCGPSR